MKDFVRAFAISASGMALERARLEVASTNLANANASKLPGGHTYIPMRVTATSKQTFDDVLGGIDEASLQGVGDFQIERMNVPPRVESDPGNPLADAQGLISVPAVNAVEEIVTIMSSVRGYESDIRAMNATQTMALKALEIGGNTV